VAVAGAVVALVRVLSCGQEL